jgi:hypothetical protein
MEYKTTIEVVTDADNPMEAADIAGEYLRGHLDTGISMKCVTKPVRRYHKIKIISVFSVLLFGFSASAYFAFTHRSDLTYSQAPDFQGVGAIQPPLKTSSFSGRFCEDWQTKKNMSAIKRINN